MVSIKNALLWWVGDIDKLNLAKERVKIKTYWIHITFVSCSNPYLIHFWYPYGSVLAVCR